MTQCDRVKKSLDLFSSFSLQISKVEKEYNRSGTYACRGINGELGNLGTYMVLALGMGVGSGITWSAIEIRTVGAMHNSTLLFTKRTF